MPKDPIKTLEDLEKRLERRVAGVLNKHADRLKQKLRADQVLKQRGPRRFPYLSKPARVEGNLLIARVFSPVGWAGVHIGPPGATTITARQGMLAIPTDFVRVNRGVPVGPHSYSGTVVFGGIIWGQAGWGGTRTGGGLRQHRAAGEKFKKQDLIPLFILKSAVVVPRRIHPQELIAWVKPGFLADLKKVVSLP